MGAVLQYGLYLAVLVLLGIPLGAYIKKVMDGESDQGAHAEHRLKCICSRSLMRNCS